MYQINETHSRSAEKMHYNWKEVWQGMNNTVIWGTVSYLYKKYDSPTTYQEFYNYYINDTGSEEEDRRTYGRSEDYITEQAEIFKERTGGSEGLGVYKDYIMKKLFIDTMDGMKWENKAKEYLENKGFVVGEPSYIQDTQEGIDKLIYDKEGKLLFLLQVKPHTFFIGNANEGLIRDRKNAVRKESKCKEKYGVPTVFIIYNRNTMDWVKNDKGNLGFYLLSLIDKDGFSS